MPDKLRGSLRSAIVLIFGYITPALAHDPGLSALDLKLDSQRLVIHVSFARPDLESIATISTVDALAARAIDVSFDDRPAVAERVAVWADESNTVHCRMSVLRGRHTRLRVRSVLMPSLARGHRQFLSFSDERGIVVREQMLDAGASVFEITLAEPPSGNEPMSMFRQFLGLGIQHILTGYDHLLFLFGLLLVGGSLRSVAKIVTAFTVAHSLTLAAATLNLVQFSSRLIEPAIAASIIYVGVENLFRRTLSWRWLLAFGFGLVHGFGFASVLRELGIGAAADAAVPLLSFNLGVEVGQMAIAALALPLIWKLRRQPMFAAHYVPACSLLVALAGGYWLIERTLLQ